jgi:membrane-associated phospholipid phosphatase
VIRKEKIQLVLITILLTANLIVAQNNTNDKSIPQTFLNDAVDAFNVGIETIKQPLNFSQKNWLTVGSIVSGTALLITVDKDIRKFALANQTNLNNKIFNFDSFYGNGYTAFFTAGLYGVGLFTGKTAIRKLGLHASEAFIISGIVTGILKILIGRRRPYGGNSQLFFRPFQLTNNDYHSLPSGHTTVAFAISTVMAQYLRNISWKIFWYGSAGMVAASRIYHNQHWASDVFLGAAVGYFVGKFVSNVNKGAYLSYGKYKIRTFVSISKIGITVSF